MRGKKTSAIESVKIITRIFKKAGIENIAYGIIIFIKNKKDHKVNIKIKEISGAILLVVSARKYKQEMRIYGEGSKEKIKKILQEELGENFRILLR